MDVKMHYYGCNLFLRLIGMRKKCADVISHMNEGVDQETGKNVLPVESRELKYCFRGNVGAVSRIISANSLDAHTALLALGIDYTKNLYPIFHFPAGMRGQTSDEKLVTTLGNINPTVNELRDFVLSKVSADRLDESMIVIGWFMHLFMDSFSHIEFSGVDSRENRRVEINIKRHSSHDSTAWIKSNALGSYFGAHGFDFGHVLAGHLPDLPAVSYSYKKELGGAIAVTENHRLFSACFRHLLPFFLKMRDECPSMFTKSSNADVLNIMEEFVCDCPSDTSEIVNYTKSFISSKGLKLDIPQHDPNWYLSGTEYNEDTECYNVTGETNWIELVHKTGNEFRVFIKTFYKMNGIELGN